jgi:hypothetical protein
MGGKKTRRGAGRENMEYAERARLMLGGCVLARERPTQHVRHPTSTGRPSENTEPIPGQKPRCGNGTAYGVRSTEPSRRAGCCHGGYLGYGFLVSFLYLCLFLFPLPRARTPAAQRLFFFVLLVWVLPGHD